MEQFTADQEEEARTQLTRFQTSPPTLACPLMGSLQCIARCVCYIKPSLVAHKAGPYPEGTITGYSVYEGGCSNVMFFGEAQP